jgi:nucleotide-binding universal stress UspA family protein
MRDFRSSSPAVVVGIDGSRDAVDAALWAVDEAVSRDISLRLIYAIDPDYNSGGDPQDLARDLATAEVAVRYAYTAVESTDKPVRPKSRSCKPDRRADFFAATYARTACPSGRPPDPTLRRS